MLGCCEGQGSGEGGSWFLGVGQQGIVFAGIEVGGFFWSTELRFSNFGLVEGGGGDDSSPGSGRAGLRGVGQQVVDSASIWGLPCGCHGGETGYRVLRVLFQLLPLARILLSDNHGVRSSLLVESWFDRTGLNRRSQRKQRAWRCWLLA